MLKGGKWTEDGVSRWREAEAEAEDKVAVAAGLFGVRVTIGGNPRVFLEGTAGAGRHSNFSSLPLQKKGFFQQKAGGRIGWMVRELEGRNGLGLPCQECVQYNHPALFGVFVCLR